MATTNKIIKILIVEDSELQRMLLLHVLTPCETFQVIGLVKNGLEAIEALKNIKPDVVLMDLHMPKMNGVDAIRHIMSTTPLPIIAMSASTDLDEVINGFHALEAGALAFTEKPGSIYDPRSDDLCAYLIQTIKLMSEVKVIRRQNQPKSASMEINPLPNPTPPTIKKDIKLIAIGVSTGGPLVLQTILSHLPADYPPILIVQHIVPGFIHGLAQWLTQVTNCLIHIAKDNQLPERGHIYFAPDNYHMEVTNSGHLSLKPRLSHNEICPSVNILFNSVAMSLKDNAIGILLTGMGSDGASQLKTMREQGAFTIAQSQATSLIYGMPGQAVAMGAACKIMSPEEIAETIASLSRG